MARPSVSSFAAAARSFHFLFGLAAAAALAGCGGDKGEAAQSKGGAGGPGGSGGGPQETVPVAVEVVGRGVASSTYGTTAVLEAENHAEIRARTTGVVRRLVHEEGDMVKAGDVLLELEDDEAALRVRQAEANLEKAKSEHARGESMRQGGMLSDREFESQQNELHVKESELDLAKLELAYTKIVAPFNGRLVRRHVDLGANISPGISLVEVMDVTPLLALVHVPANRMGFVTVGQKVHLRLDSSDTDLEGVVRLVSPIVDPQTGTVKVTVEVRSYPAGTRPGDFAQVRIVTARHENATLVPSRALFEEQGQNILFVAVDGKASRRAVKTGFVDGEKTEILEGIDEKDLVVVKGQRDLRDGLPIDIREGPPGTVAVKAAPDSSGAAAAPTT